MGVFGSTPEARYLRKPSFKLDVSHKNQTLGSHKHLLLRSLASDPSYLREHLASDIARAAGLSVPGFSFVRVFVNDQPYGLYGLMEDYKTQFLRNEFGNGSGLYENGILFSGDYNATLDFLGEDQTKYNRSTNDDDLFPNNYYSIQQAADVRRSRSSFRRLIAFTQFLTNTSDTVDNVEPVTAWNRYLETSSFLKRLVAIIVICFFRTLTLMIYLVLRWKFYLVIQMATSQQQETTFSITTPMGPILLSFLLLWRTPWVIQLFTI